MTPIPSRLFSSQIFGRDTRKRVDFTDLLTTTLQTLQWKNGQSQQLNPRTSQDTIPIYSLSRVPQSTNLLVADEGGYLHVLQDWFNPVNRDLNQFPSFTTSIHVTDNSAVYTVKCLSGNRVVVGCGSGHVCVFDLVKKSVSQTFDAHFKAVKKVDCFTDDVLVSCGKDNKICVFDLRTGRNPVNVVHDVHSPPFTDQPKSRRRSKKTITTAESAASCSVTDFIFLDEHHIVSAGSSDGRLKEWDLRVSHKLMKKCTPCQVVEYPMASNVKGYSCLQLHGSKLYAATVNYEIFKFDVGRMTHETTFVTPSKICNYSKIDVHATGKFLVVGSEEPKVHIFCTTRVGGGTLDVQIVNPVKSLNHDKFSSTSVCCPIFHLDDETMVTTGGDASIVSKWAPSIRTTTSRDLEKEAFKQEIESGWTSRTLLSMHTQSVCIGSKMVPLKTEFTKLSTNVNYTNNNKENDLLEGKKTPRDPVCFAKLDSFPNYVLDGMRLPHVCVKKIKVKARIQTRLNFPPWEMGPVALEGKVLNAALECSQDTTTPKRKALLSPRTTPQDTPKGKNARKRRKVSSEASPKISTFFSRCTLSSPSDGNL